MKSKVKTSLLVTLLLVSGIAGRIFFQFIPSVEPLTAISILLGFLFGPTYGFFAGSSGFYLSNYLVWGGQGLWTPFQSVGAGIAGVVGGLFGKRKTFYSFVLSLLIGTILYEAIVTIPMAFIFSPLSPFIYVLTSLPFSIIHLISTVSFGLILYEFSDKLEEWGYEKIEGKILAIRNLADRFASMELKFLFSKKKSS